MCRATYASFTPCLPGPSKGEPVTFGIGSSAPVSFTTDTIDMLSSGANPTFDSPSLNEATLQVRDGGGNDNALFSATASNNEDVRFGDVTGLEFDADSLTTGTADLTAATAITVNAMRSAFQIQKLLERDARGGTRYTEIIRSHFGVVSPDQRVQRPEYLGGGSTMIRLSAVPQTGQTATTPQGNLAAYGISSGSGVGFTKSFTEHGMIIGLVSVRADLNYQQGLDRMFSRSTRYDFYWPSFAHLGEQAVLNKEIFAQGSDDLVEDAATFGYQERYAEYRYKPSIVTADMRSNHGTSLDVWHLSQDFPSLPVLDEAFIVEDPPIDRIIAIPSEPHIIFDAFFDYRCARPMPTYGQPELD